MRLNDAGARFIAEWEGCILHPYNDSDGNATIGIGHLLHFGPVNAEDLARWRGFTQERAYQLLERDVAEAEAAIHQRIHRQLPQAVYNMVVDLVFNCGPGVLDGPVGNLLNAGNIIGAADAWQAWCHGNGGVVIPGLVRRREAERQVALEQPAPYMPADEARWEHQYDQLAHRNGPWARLRRRVLRRYMRARLLKILQLVAHEHDGWQKLNRQARYHALLARL
jgi:GH24 family phage-related lysozyme (muramidase)